LIFTFEWVNSKSSGDVSAPNANELVALVEGGSHPRGRSWRATVEAAAMIGRRDVGEIAIGAAADFVVAAGDPLAHPDLLAQPALVLKAGREP
jgi:imidazolonepropionase-like amidohydrolase